MIQIPSKFTAPLWMVCVFLSATVKCDTSMMIQTDFAIFVEFVSAVKFPNKTVLTENKACDGTLVTCSSSGFINTLNFSYQSLTGSLPSSLANLTNLVSFSVSMNSLTSTIPSELSRWGSMIKSFDVSSNLLNGTLPSSLRNWSQLQRIDVSNNTLTGTVSNEYSSWGAFVTQLDLERNAFVGELPSSFGVAFTNLVKLDVSNNKLTGPLPESYSHMKMLQHLKCSNNTLSGTLPASYANMSRMQTFEVENNTLTGTLPPELSVWGDALETFNVCMNTLNGTLPEVYAKWTRIVMFEVHSNSLTGTLPSNYSVWARLTQFLVRKNALHGTLPPEYSQWSLLTVFTGMSNSFRGTLPPQYSNWSNVIQIILNNNSLRGSIPTSWKASMTKLRTLGLSDNMLNGTIAFNSATLIFLSISFNNFSGALPTKLWPFLMLLDAQNNPMLSGTLTQFPYLTVASVCSTNICATNRSPAALIACFPVGAIASLDDSEVSSFVAMAEFFLTAANSSSCNSSSPTPTTTNTMPPHHRENLTNASAATTVLHPSAQATTASIAAASAAVTTFTGVDAADAQMLVSILASPCTCTAAESSAASPSLLLLALSPFSQLGSSWAVIGSSLLCCAFVCLHTVSVHLVNRCNSATNVRRGHTLTVPTVLGRWISGDADRRRDVLMRVRYPNLSVSVVLLLMPGVLRGVVSVVTDMSSNDKLGETAVAIGFFCLMCSAAALEKLVYRHADEELSVKNNIEGVFHFAKHRRVGKLFSPISVSVARCVLPQGRWVPEMSRKSFGGIVSSLADRGRRAWCALPLSNAVVQILNAVGGSHAVCNALQSLTIIVLAAVSVFFGVIRPHRALLASYLTCVSLLLSCVVTLLAMLCRLGSVDRSAVNGFGVFASVAMMVMKAYHIALPLVEAWLIGRKKKQQSPHRTTARVPHTANQVLPMEPPGKHTSIVERNGLLRTSQMTTFPLVALREEKQTYSVAAGGDRQRIILSKLVSMACDRAEVVDLN
ncbi:GP46-like surface antigen, putative [Bodo saltans]|uniref:GP46-like surface antigen, putative n=1 Tax=Bodo saltans TaxID=75058 RepID=A0A0S4J4S8_BODSA|nr:GP46-like surface antigen, putative [Bodo saltans]|eukprot:CUG21518.1 GP46-like surface antigen, putative [Bodo saltans]